jgi:hypothetical protein
MVETQVRLAQRSQMDQPLVNERHGRNQRHNQAASSQHAPATSQERHQHSDECEGDAQS